MTFTFGSAADDRAVGLGCLAGIMLGLALIVFFSWVLERRRLRCRKARNRIR